MLNKAYEMSYQSGLVRNSVLDEFMSYHDIKQISCGNCHTIILKSDGSVWSCGYNQYGKLGLGDTTNRTTFTQVNTNINNDVKQIACSYDCTFILKNDGSLWSCGRNDNGYLGLGGDGTDRYTFTQVTTNINNDVKQIACGRYHTFIIKNDGSVWCCGDNSRGQLGLNDTTNRNIFTQVTTNINNDVKQIDCGDYHTFILKNDGSVWSCGYNAYGQLGLNDTDSRNTFTKVTANINNDVKQIACGGYHIFIIKNDDSLWCCGWGGHGQLGLSGNRNTFTQVTTNINNDVKEVICGDYYTFILKNDGSVLTCGWNGYGNLGLGDIIYRPTITQVTTNINNDVKQIACSEYYTFILKTDGSLWACGRNDLGQLGLGDTTNRNTFVAHNFSNIKSVVINDNDEPVVLKNDGYFYDKYGKYEGKIACGYYHIFILKNDGSLWACGNNGNGQLGLGDNTNRNTLTQVTTNINNDVKEVICGGYFTIIIKNDGSIWACGQNNSGQLGLGDNTNRNTFTQVTTNVNNDVKQISCGEAYAMIVKNDSSLWACGNNDGYKLGFGNNTNINKFTQVTTNINNDVKQVACGQNVSYIVKNDGSLWSCGYSAYGQLGLGSTNSASTFQQVISNINNDVKYVTCGSNHAFIIKNDDSVYSCGRGTEGQLGMSAPNNGNITTFTKVTNDVKQVTCGDYHTLIIKNDGSLWVTGYNNYGQLGANDSNAKTCYKSFTQVTMNVNNDVKQVSCGYYHGLILKNDGSILGCGHNGYGQLGLGDTTQRLMFDVINDNSIYLTNSIDKPIRKQLNNKYQVVFSDTQYIITEEEMKQADKGLYHALFINNSNQLVSYAISNDYHQAGNGIELNTFVINPTLTNIKYVACSDYSSYVYTYNDELYVFGRNEDGQLGLGGTETVQEPILVPNITGVKKMIAMDATCIVLLNNGDLYAAGENDQGQFGLGDYNARNVFTKITSNVKNFWYNKRTLIYHSDNYIYGVGNNDCNKLGLGHNVSSTTTPIKLLYAPGVKTVGIGNNNIMLVLSSNSTPIITYIAKEIPNFQFALYDDDLVSCEVYLNDTLLKTINNNLTSQIQIVQIPEGDIINGTNSIKILVQDSDGNFATSITNFDKNPLNIEVGSSILYKEEKYIVEGITTGDGVVNLQLNKEVHIPALEGDTIRLFNDNIEVKCECDGSGHNIPMNLISISKTNRNTIKETYELEIDCRTFAPNIILNKATGTTKINKIFVDCTYKNN